MRTGFVSFDRQPYMESIKIAEELGFDYLELLMDGNSRREVLEAERETVVDALAAADLDILVHLPFPVLIANPHEHQRAGAIREMKRCIEIAGSIGAEKGVIHPDSYGWVRVWDEDDVDVLLVEAIHELNAYAADHGVELCVENLFEGYLDVYGFDLLFENTDVSMTLDTGHAAIVGMDEPEMASFLADRHDRVSHLHLNDTRHLDVGYRSMDEHLPLGYGTIDFETVLEPLRDGWEGTASIELDTPNFEYLETSQRQLREILA